ncbi:hypothetical protein [Undibacterium sp. Ji49W]|uniref:hypothetical protein n=1 Tax=Undibacterium sp. Ji49W TaxID=3413040 RepID=UPI003BEF59F2
MNLVFGFAKIPQPARNGLAFSSKQIYDGAGVETSVIILNKKIWIDPDNFSSAVSASEYPQSSMIERACTNP